MGRRTKKYRTTAVTAILVIGVFCYWLMVNPQLLLFREGLQLFLCNSDYLADRLSVPGGAAQYLGEFIVQFFLMPVNGAVCYALLFVAEAWLTARLLDLRDGRTRPLTEVNSNRTESLHAWSSNSRWILFTSRRDDGLYTRLYLAHIDQHGRAGKPFMLPQRHLKDYYRRLMYSYNTPDFTVRPIHLQTLRLQHVIEDAARIKPQTLSCNDHVWTTPQVCVVKIN